MIPLTQLFKILEDCAALSTEDGCLFYPTTSELTGADDNEFACFSWRGEHYDESANFAEGPNRSVTMRDNTFTLTDTKGEEHTFYVLGPMNIEERDLAIEERDLANYARVVLEILANEPEWSSDTTDRLADEAIERGLAITDNDGMFTLT